MQHRNAVLLQFLCSGVQCSNATQLQRNMNRPLLCDIDTGCHGFTANNKWKNWRDFYGDFKITIPGLFECNSEFVICLVVRHGNANSIQNPSTMTNPTMEPYCILLPL